MVLRYILIAWFVIVPLTAQTTITLPDITQPTVLLMDVSGSMDGEDANGKIKINAAREAVQFFINNVISEQKINNVTTYQDSMSLITFANQARTLQSFTTDLQQVGSAATRLSADGGTNMRAGLELAIQQIQALRNPTTGKSNIIMVTDGMPTASNSGENDNDILRQEIITLLSRQFSDPDSCLYIIPIGDPGASPDAEDYVDVAFIRQMIAAAGCGEAYPLTNLIELIRIFTVIRIIESGRRVADTKTVPIQKGQQINIENIIVNDVDQIRIDVFWQEQNTFIQTQLFDPRGIEVVATYPGAGISNTSQSIIYIINNPVSGNWSLTFRGDDIAPGSSVNVNVLISQPETPPTLPPTNNDSGNSALPVALLILAMITGAVAVVIYLNMSNANPVPQAQLVVREGSSIGQVILITEPRIIMGRSADHIINLRDPAVSRNHAEIIFQHGSFYLRDLNSRSGTKVNGNQVSQHMLRSGDRITIGFVTFEFIQLS